MAGGGTIRYELDVVRSEPDLEHILKLWRRLASYWRPQDALDDEVRAMEVMDQPIAAAKAVGVGGPGARLQSGIWAQLVKRDAAIITFTPFIRFNPPDPEDPKSREESSLLESWMNAALGRSGLSATLIERLARSLIGYGRAWTKTLWVPQAWAGPEFEEAAEGLGSGDGEARKGAARRLQALRRDAWPFTIRYVDPLRTYTYFDSPFHLPEVIEVRRMTKEAAAASYGTEAVEAAGSVGGHVEVIEYSNHEWQATVIPARSGGRLVNIWRHGLGRSPYTLAETNITTTTIEGLRWLPSLFHAKELIQAFDEALSDWRTNTHENALGHILQFFDPEYLAEDDKTAGRPKANVLEPGGVSAWVKGEDVRLGPVPTLTPEHGSFRQFLYSMIQANAVQPVLQGETKSGDSFTLIAGAHQIAERKFSPAMDALLQAAEDRARALIRCLRALAADPLGDTGKVFVFDRYRGKGAVGITAADTIGWESAIQARGEPALPMDRNREVAIAQGLRALGVAETLVLEELRYEDPEGVRRRSQKEKLEASIFEQVILPYAVQRAQQKIQAPTEAEMAQLQQLQGAASPGVAQAVQGALSGQGAPAPPEGEAAPAGAPPGLLQAMANMRRAGTPYAPRMEMGGLAGP